MIEEKKETLKKIQDQLAERAAAQREAHLPKPAMAGTGVGNLNARGEHPVYKALRLRADQEYDDTPHVCPPSLPDDDDTPDEPALCLDADLQNHPLATLGYVICRDGSWLVSADHMAKLVAQADHLDKQILKVAAPGSWPELSTFEDSVKELKKLLPGGGVK